MNAPAPTVETVQYFITKWKNSTTTQQGENFLTKLFLKTYPKNTNFDEILTKVCALNCIYSTNLQQEHIVLVAQHILKQRDVDARLAARDLTLIEDLSYILLPNEKTQSFYSFMTKYCGHHVIPLIIDDAEYNSAKEFPAFDGIAEEMLRDYNFKDHFTEEFEKSDLKNYPRYVEVMTLMRKHYKLEEFTFREVDIFLNLCGRNEIKRIKNNNKLPRQSHPRKFGQDSSATSKAKEKKKPRHRHSGKSSTPRAQSLSKQGGRQQSNKPSSSRASSGRPSNGKPSSSRPSGGSPSTSSRAQTSGSRPTRNRPRSK